MANFMHSTNRWLRWVITAALALTTLNSMLNWIWPASEGLCILFFSLFLAWTVLCMIYENKEDYETRMEMEKAVKDLAAAEEDKRAKDREIKKLSNENAELREVLSKVSDVDF